MALRKAPAASWASARRLLARVGALYDIVAFEAPGIAPSALDHRPFAPLGPAGIILTRAGRIARDRGHCGYQPAFVHVLLGAAFDLIRAEVQHHDAVSSACAQIMPKLMAHPAWSADA